MSKYSPAKRKRPGNAVLLTMRQSGSNSERCFYRADLISDCPR